MHAEGSQSNGPHTPAAGTRVFRRAHAKVNLALAVGRPIEEGEHAGMHPIASWMAPIDLADDLEVIALEPDRFSMYAIQWAPGAPQPNVHIDWSVTDDLAVRAHLLMEREAGRTLPVRMKLDKRIPVGAGLGGGSTDAAAMLLAINELFALNFGENKLVSLAHQLGSDVPFFLRAGADAGGHAIVEALGQSLATTPATAGHLVLILPRFTCPTGPVYHAFDEQFDDLDDDDRHTDTDNTAPDPSTPASPHAPDDDDWRRRVDRVKLLAKAGAERGLQHEPLFNDLAEPAARVEPRVADLQSHIERTLGVTPHVTGSGAAMFLVCQGGRVEAELLAEQLDKLLEDCRAIPARLV